MQSEITRPLTPFFLFCQSKKEHHMKKEMLAEEWRNLSQDDRTHFSNRFRSDKQKYLKYLGSVYGEKIIMSYTENKKHSHKYKLTRMRAILGECPNIKPMDKEVYKGMSRVLVTSGISNIGGVSKRLGKGEQRGAEGGQQTDTYFCRIGASIG
eukprot:TRINITY_DN7037_c0_g5_i1.p2 TRINITY_DN7037_c0_g5~~TRINITY_DN7037_c0_g5_i1.p2  ORF type:complete len:153 (-),score=14.16 TRINITY_DN7037_c0_g5_i1:157-615(-)